MEAKRFYRFSLWIAGFLSVITGIFWINNTVSAVRYHYILFTGRESGDFDNPDIQGLWSFLDWTTVDVSTVTTLIPFLGFLLIWYGLLHIRTGDEWPFFPGYDRLNVALGLLGTVWGIILIGYYPSEKISIQALMHCLHTAMFSTFAAVGWVMVIVPSLVHPWLHAIRKKLNMQTDDTELGAMVESFIGNVRTAGNAMQKTAADTVQFRDNLNQVNGIFAEMLQTVSKERDAERQFRQDAVNSISAIAGTLSGLGHYLEQLKIENTKLTQKQEELHQVSLRLKEEKAQLIAEQKQLTENNTSLQWQLSEVNEERNQLKKKNNEITEESEQLRIRLNQADMEKLALDEQLKNLKKQNENLSDELEKSGGELKNLHKQLDSIQSILKNIE